MVLFECICEEGLGQVFRVFVVGLPLEAYVFVDRFPVAREDGIERTLAHDVIRAACLDDR